MARKTIRQAIDALVDEQVLKRVVGIGTFVVPEKMDLRVRLHSYSEDMMRRGMVPDAHVLKFDEIKASAHLASQLMVDEGTPVVRFKRLLLADGTPMSLDENYMPADLVPGFVDGQPPSKLYQTLHERYGILLEWGEDQVESTAASPAQAQLLAVEDGFPLLQVTRYATSANAWPTTRSRYTVRTATSSSCHCSAWGPARRVIPPPSRYSPSRPGCKRLQAPGGGLGDPPCTSRCRS